MLSEQERDLFGRLSVFSGGWTLEAAEAVGAEPVSGIEEGDVLDLLSGLVDKSMVVGAEASGEEEGALRYRMLEPVRQYARERLEESGEAADATRGRHAAFFLAVAEEAGPALMGAQQEAWLERLEREHDNLRAALGWTLERGKVQMGLRLGGALGEFWYVRGHWSEGQRWLETALTNDIDAPGAVRAKVLARAGLMVWEQGDYERSVTLSEESLALFREVGSKAEVTATLRTLAGEAALDRVRSGLDAGRGSRGVGARFGRPGRHC